ncbi:hypothetical protein J1614_011926 [Plenodomus biglobosus]|nr:hypothetical protein J1614_011926 [Plenodomus biglobosus]
MRAHPRILEVQLASPQIDQVTGPVHDQLALPSRKDGIDLAGTKWNKAYQVITSFQRSLGATRQPAFSDTISTDANSMESPVESPGGVPHRVGRQSDVSSGRGQVWLRESQAMSSATLE